MPYSVDINQLGAKIKRRRTELNLSQDELLQDRYSKSYLSKVERGRVAPSQEFLHYVAARLDIAVSELVAGTSFEATETSRSNRNFQNLLLDAHLALEARQGEKVARLLSELAVDGLPLELKAVYYAIHGEAALLLADLPLAVEQLERALQLYENALETEALKVEQVRNLLGLAYYRQHKNGLALDCHRGCLEAFIAGRVNEPLFKMKIYYNLANDYSQLSEWQQALDLYAQAATLAETVEAGKDLAGIYWGWGLVLENTGGNSQATPYLEKSVSLYEKLGERELALTVKNLVGRALVKNGEYLQAQTVLESVLADASKLANDTLLYSSYTNLAYLYEQLGQWEQAEENARLGVEAAQKSGSNLYAAYAMAKLAEIYLARGAADEAISYFELALVKIKSTDSYNAVAELHFRYARVLEEMGHLAEALEKLRLAYHYRGQ